MKAQTQTKLRSKTILSLPRDALPVAPTITSIASIKPDNVTKQVVLWEPTPSKELNNLFNNYLMLSKIRLTSEFRFITSQEKKDL